MQTSNYHQKELQHDENWIDAVYDSSKERYEFNNNFLNEIFYSTESNFDLYGNSLRSILLKLFFFRGKN